MPIRDVAGISRPGVFESIQLPGVDARVTPQRGTAASVTFRATGPDATSTPEYRGPNVSSPHTQEYVAQSAGAVSAPMWPSAAPVRRGRR